jgi:outer membrane immunogenic protein
VIKEMGMGMGMRRTVLVGAGLLSIAGFSGLASAADLPVRTYPTTPPAAPVAAYTWTGCHVGIHAGGVVSEDTATGVSGKSGHFGSAGFVGGGQIGCDYQFAFGWVAGIEGRAAWSSLKTRMPALS